MRKLLITLGFASIAGVAQAGDRYGAGVADIDPSREAYGAPRTAPARLLSWKQKTPAPAPMTAPPAGYGRVAPPAPPAEGAYRVPRPSPVVTPTPATPAPAPSAALAPQAAVNPDRLNTPVQGRVMDSVYSRTAARAAAADAARAAQKQAGTPPTSLYDAPPSKPYASKQTRLMGGPVEVDPDRLPTQPTLAQQMADDETVAMAEAKAARLRLLETRAKSGDGLTSSQDAVR